MDTRSFKLASLMLALSLVGSARPATAQPQPSLNIVLHLCDDPGIQANLVNRAKREMTRIYRDAGVDINWISDAAAKDDGPDDPQPLESTPPLTLVILCRELTDELTVDTTALGAAVGTREYRGRMAYVFYDRVERTAQTYLNVTHEPGTDDMYTVIVLAHAMAHEVGHLLLPYGHSPTGLMRAEWEAQDLRLAVNRQLNFTNEQAEQMRDRLLAGIADTPSPVPNRSTGRSD
jgi:hypothetical protein